MSFDILSKLEGPARQYTLTKYMIFSQKKSTILLIDFYFYCSNRFVIGADGGTRTHMVSRWILSPVRLPVPPQRHVYIRLGIYNQNLIYINTFNTKSPLLLKKFYIFGSQVKLIPKFFKTFNSLFSIIYVE